MLPRTLKYYIYIHTLIIPTLIYDWRLFIDSKYVRTYKPILAIISIEVTVRGDRLKY
jgi:hypothetical protein